MKNRVDRAVPICIWTHLYTISYLGALVKGEMRIYCTRSVWSNRRVLYGRRTE